MRCPFKILTVSLLVLGLAACGGGSSDEASGVSPTDVPSLPNNVTGTISIAANIISDTDTNDPNSSLVDNSSYETSQTIISRASVHGFVTESGTGVNVDQLGEQADVSDYYTVSLQRGQAIQMQVIDHELSGTEGLSGDLDLVLYDANRYPVDTSDSVDEFDEVVAPLDGIYYLHVYAFRGSSKYVIKIVDQGTQNAYQAQSFDFVPGQAIFKAAPQSSVLAKSSVGMPAQVKFSHRNTGQAALATWELEEVKSSGLGAQFAMTDEMKLGEQKLATLRQIKKMRLEEGMEYAEPNYIRRPLRTPNDLLYPLQWNYPAMKLPEAWDITVGTPIRGEIIVAVIDTGVYLDHVELVNKMVPGYDFVGESRSNDGDGIDPIPDDLGNSRVFNQSFWHGTHVSGIVGAASNNGIGVAGVSWGAKIMPMKGLGENSRGDAEGTLYDILQCLRYAAGLENDSGTLPDTPAHIINLSIGGPSYSQAEAELYKEVSDSGIIVVASAGNNSSDDLVYPASYEGVISVSAIDATYDLAPYSSFGPEVDIAAPGGNLNADADANGNKDGVWSLFVSEESYGRASDTSIQQGTSMSAPHVSGMFALMKAVYPALDSQDVLLALQAGALTDDAGLPGRDDRFGFGIANALKAVEEARRLAREGGVPIELPPSFVATPPSVNLVSDDSAQVVITNRGEGSPISQGVETDADWLRVIPLQVNSQGVGRYSFLVNREDLADGIYMATATFSFNSAPSVEVKVAMTVGEVETAGSLSQLYVLLLDPNNNDEVIAQALTNKNADGSVSYTFSDVPEGRYLIYAGTDIDNDGMICQAGEGCGAYPSLSGTEEITVDSSGGVSGTFDFVADIVANSAALTPVLGLDEEEQLPAELPPSLPRLDIQSSLPSDSKKILPTY